MAEAERKRSGVSTNGARINASFPRVSYLRIVVPSCVLFCVFTFKQAGLIHEQVSAELRKGTQLAYLPVWDDDLARGREPRERQQREPRERSLNSDSGKKEAVAGSGIVDDNNEGANDNKDDENFDDDDDDESLGDDRQNVSDNIGANKNNQETEDASTGSTSELSMGFRQKGKEASNIAAQQDNFYAKHMGIKKRRETRLEFLRKRRDARRNQYNEDKKFDFHGSKVVANDWAPPPTGSYFSTFPILESNVLPDMTTKKGGIIFFLHVPKTGGQTIRHGFDQRKKARKRKRLDLRSTAEKMFDIDRHKENIDSLFRNTFQKSRRSEEIDDAGNSFEQLIRDKIRFIKVNWLHIFRKRAVPQIEKFLTAGEANKGEILFVEVHGMDNYHALELEPFIHNWREKSKSKGVPFFSFVLLREAISAQVSFFNFYYISPGDFRFCKNILNAWRHRCKRGKGGHAGRSRDIDERRILNKYRGKRAQSFRLPRRPERRRRLMESRDYLHGIIDGVVRPFRERASRESYKSQNYTHEELEDQLVKLSYDNPQCLFLARGERTFGDDPDLIPQRTGLKRLECQKVYMSLRRTMDWIGRTDRLSDETLPLLTTIMFKNATIGKNLPRTNKSPEESGFVTLSKIKPSTREALEKKSQLDQELYHRAVEDYTLDKWQNDTNF